MAGNEAVSVVHERALALGLIGSRLVMWVGKGTDKGGSHLTVLLVREGEGLRKGVMPI